MPSRAIKDGWVMVESSDKMWFTGEGNGKPLSHSCHENPMNSMKRPKDKPPGSIDVQHATGKELRNSSRKSEEAESKWK